MTILVEKNVPIPTNLHGNTKYPWEELEVGDSFYTDVSVKSAYALCYQRNRQQRELENEPKKYIGRKEGEGSRIWRVA